MIAVKKLKMVDSTKGHLEVYCDDVSELSSINLGEIEIELVLLLTLAQALLPFGMVIIGIMCKGGLLWI